jgi:hypothetical protein
LNNYKLSQKINTVYELIILVGAGAHLAYNYCGGGVLYYPNIGK